MVVIDGNIVELSLSLSVPSIDRECETYVVPDVRSFRVLDFCGASDYSTLSVVKGVWRYDEVDPPAEVSIWSVKGDSSMPSNYMPEFTDADGVLKLALCLDNVRGAGAVFMSGFLKIELL